MGRFLKVESKNWRNVRLSPSSMMTMFSRRKKIITLTDTVSYRTITCPKTTLTKVSDELKVLLEKKKELCKRRLERGRFLQIPDYKH